MRRTRSGRAVRPPPSPAPKQARKTRKKMVLVEVEVSEEEDDPTDENPDNSITEQIDTDPVKTTFTDEFPPDQEPIVEETVVEEPVIEEPVQTQPENLVDDSNSVLNEFHEDSSVDQHDSRSIPFSSKNDSELQSEQNSNQENFENRLEH